MENKGLSNGEKILLLGIIHYAVAVFLIVAKLAPFNVIFEVLEVTDQTYAFLLVDTMVMGSLLYVLSGVLQKNQQKD